MQSEYNYILGEVFGSEYSITENGELVDNEVKYYLGHRYSSLERESLYNKKSREWIYDEFKLTLSVDDNEDFYVSYVIPAEEFLSSKYLCKWDHDAIKEYDIYYRKDSIFTLNLSDAVIKNNFKIVLSYVNRDEKEDYKNMPEDLCFLKYLKTSEKLSDQNGEKYNVWAFYPENYTEKKWRKLFAEMMKKYFDPFLQDFEKHVREEYSREQTCGINITGYKKFIEKGIIFR